MQNTNNDSGWVCLHRKLLNNPICEKADYLAVWVHLLLMANHKETTFIWNNKKQILKAGQLLTGRKQLSKKTGVAESQVYKILKYLELEQQIEQQKTTKYTVITIVNWGMYQEKEQQKEQQSNNRVTTKEQQSNTYNNDNNVNNEDNRTGVPEDTRNTDNDSDSDSENNISKDMGKIPKEEKVVEVVDRDLLFLVELYNNLFQKNIHSYKGFEANYEYWKDIHSLDKMKIALQNARLDKFWKNKMTLTILFRRKNTRGENVDYIEDLSQRVQSSSGMVAII